MFLPEDDKDPGSQFNVFMESRRTEQVSAMTHEYIMVQFRLIAKKNRNQVQCPFNCLGTFF